MARRKRPRDWRNGDSSAMLSLSTGSRYLVSSHLTRSASCYQRRDTPSSRLIVERLGPGTSAFLARLAGIGPTGPGRPGKPSPGSSRMVESQPKQRGYPRFRKTETRYTLRENVMSRVSQ
jgi:hypothetical protein